jgi:hypothetical protein
VSEDDLGVEGLLEAISESEDAHDVATDDTERLDTEHLDDLSQGDPLDSLDDGGSAALGDLPVTGEARVDAATARLDEVADLPTSDHVALYDDVHRRLQDALADADVR